MQHTLNILDEPLTTHIQPSLPNTEEKLELEVTKSSYQNQFRFLELRTKLNEDALVGNQFRGTLHLNRILDVIQ